MTRFSENGKRASAEWILFKSRPKAIVLFAATLIALVILVIVSGLFVIRMEQYNDTLSARPLPMAPVENGMPQDAIPPFEIFPEEEVLPKFFMAFGFAFLGMTVVASLAFLFSTLTNNAIGPIIGTMAIVIGFTIITNLNLEAFQVVRKFLFTTYISSWMLFFDFEPDWSQILASILVCLAHSAVFFFTALWIFNRKDILT